MIQNYSLKKLVYRKYAQRKREKNEENNWGKMRKMQIRKVYQN